mmetsp:Transcript_2024/g.5421  ORF Transcript_2024/g.5421 Transcript_2024/m.5421 type:complete len:307 (-) Transcript_2024:450-1370(-)
MTQNSCPISLEPDSTPSNGRRRCELYSSSSLSMTRPLRALGLRSGFASSAASTAFASAFSSSIASSSSSASDSAASPSASSSSSPFSSASSPSASSSPVTSSSVSALVAFLGARLRLTASSPVAALRLTTFFFSGTSSGFSASRAFSEVEISAYSAFASTSISFHSMESALTTSGMRIPGVASSSRARLRSQKMKKAVRARLYLGFGGAGSPSASVSAFSAFSFFSFLARLGFSASPSAVSPSSPPHAAMRSSKSSLSAAAVASHLTLRSGAICAHSSASTEVSTFASRSGFSSLSSTRRHAQKCW